MAIASGGDAAFGGIEIALEGELVSISAVNPVSAKQFAKLESIMSEIAAMSLDEVSRAYKQKMMATFDDSESRGAGLAIMKSPEKVFALCGTAFLKMVRAGICFVYQHGFKHRHSTGRQVDDIVGEPTAKTPAVAVNEAESLIEICGRSYQRICTAFGIPLSSR